MYDLNYFIRKAENTSDDIWGMGAFNNNGKKCFYGLCGAEGKYGTFDIEDYPEAVALTELDDDTKWVHINDGYDKRYQQKTPKERCLARLYDLKAEQAAVEQTNEIISNSPEIGVIKTKYLLTT